MSLQEIRARDRRMAAVHEAGHLTIAGMLGITQVSAWIAPTGTGADVLSEKTWIGRVQIYSPGLPKRKRKLIAVAGSVAEYCWLGDEIEPDFWCEPDIMSDSDWVLADCLAGEPDRACRLAIEQAGELLRRSGPLWDRLIAHARQLIVDSRELMSFPALASPWPPSRFSDRPDLDQRDQ